MNTAEVVMVAYWIAVSGLTVCAVAGAVWMSRHLPAPELHVPVLRASLDCRDGVHGGCFGCDGCPARCHDRVAA